MLNFLKKSLNPIKNNKNTVQFFKGPAQHPYCKQSTNANPWEKRLLNLSQKENSYTIYSDPIEPITQIGATCKAWTRYGKVVLTVKI